MLMPKRTKYRKMHRGRRRGNAKGGLRVNFGDYGLQALDAGWITSRQIESARVAITRGASWWKGVDQHLSRQAGDSKAR